MTPNLPAHSDGMSVNLAELLQYKSHVSGFLSPSMSIWSQLNGQHKSRKLGRGMDFSEVRPYQIGDDVRNIDWRVTARTGKAHTKLYTEEHEQPVMLLVDLCPNMKFGSKLLLKSVQACHFAALLSWLTASEKNRIGAVIFNGINLYECKPTARRQGVLKILDTLIKAHDEMLKTENTEISTMHKALEHLHRLCPKGSEISIISDFYLLTKSDKKRLSELRRHNRMQCIGIFDPLEQGNTDFRGFELIADSKSSALLNFASKNTRKSLADAFLAHQQFIEALTLSLAIPFYSLGADLPLLQQFNNIKHNASL